MAKVLSDIESNNIAIIRRWYKEVWNNRRTDYLHDFLSENFVAHYEHTDLKGIENFRVMFVNKILSTFPDGNFEIIDIIACENHVVARIKAIGTQTKELFGIPPSNTKIEVSAMSWYRVIDNKIHELWTNWSLIYVLGEMLKNANSEIKTLREIIPICSYCKQIRNDRGYFETVEAYISKHSKADFSHTICPNCLKKHYPDMERRDA